MNHGKICVSVCAKTADELIEKIKRAESLADVIEIRFDWLNDWKQIGLVLQNLSQTTYSYRKFEILATFRPKDQGGNGDWRLRDRLAFWHETLTDNIFDYADLEYDLTLQNIYQIVSLPIVRSFHDFNGIPNEFGEIRKAVGRRPHQILKYAITTQDIFDGIEVFKLIKPYQYRRKPIIPIAMGESGKWTRILGLGHGAFMTYASLDSDKETAPGQVTAQDLIEVYRAKELNENTEVYGILGSNTSVSLSPYIHNLAFKHHKLNSVFVPLQVHNLDEFILRMVKPETREIDLNFKGFSVTIPHKQSIIKHLDFIDETAKKIGAVNTVKIIDGKLYGYNTDAHGFIEPLKQVYGDLNSAKVAVLGAGGASKACVYGLEQNGANVTVFDGKSVRSSEFKARSFAEFDVIVNTTPLGMKGKFEGETPLTAEQIQNANLIYDLVYIPFQTQFMSEADQVNVPKIGGMAMLVAQALEQQKIWTGLDAPMKEISAEVLRRM
jgi:3-dehydroquinate dehydratase/shikimate dehydrogenase